MSPQKFFAHLCGRLWNVHHSGTFQSPCSEFLYLGSESGQVSMSQNRHESFIFSLMWTFFHLPALGKCEERLCTCQALDGTILKIVTSNMFIEVIEDQGVREKSLSLPMRGCQAGLVN